MSHRTTLIVTAAAMFLSGTGASGAPTFASSVAPLSPTERTAMTPRQLVHEPALLAQHD